jgi:8-oxo-dGTP pyrophosphatase MutT (NUDIX family)
MEHSGELWQQFAQNGERLDIGGYDATLNNPKRDLTAPRVGNINVWLYRHTAHGVEVLFQKRSPYVDRSPGAWDISFGGHINYQESISSAVIREGQEEIGADIDPSKLEFAVAFAVQEVNIIVTEYIYDYTDQPENFHFDDHEVSEVKWIPLAEFEDFIIKYGKKPLRKHSETRSIVRRLLEEKALLAQEASSHAEGDTL